MLVIKELIVLSAILFLALLGLLGISNPYWNNSSQNQSEKTSKEFKTERVPGKEFTEEFYHCFDLIQNKPVNKKFIQTQIESVQSEFEREYLSALLKKREGNYSASFDQLFVLLDHIPKELSFYEELAYSGKVSGNLDKLMTRVNEEKYKTNNYYLYLSAMLGIQRGNASEAINKFNLLIEKNFISKELFYQSANAFRTIGNYEEAFVKLQEAEKLCSEDDSFKSKIINLKGTLYFLSGNFDQAGKEYNSALGLAVQNGNKPEEIKSIANLAIIKDQYGDIESARKDFIKSIKMAEAIQNKELLAFLYSELGVSYTYTNSLVEARENYQKSFLLYEMMKNYERLAYLSSNIGSLYLQISNYKSAHEYFETGLKYSRENKLGQVLNLTGLADVYSNESNYIKALVHYKRAKEIADSIRDISSSVKIDQGIGALYYNINRPLYSLEILKQAASGVKENESPFELVNLYSKIGTVYSSIDSFDQAEKYFIRGLNITKVTGDIYNSIVLQTELAHNYLLKKNYQKAAELLTTVQRTAKEYELTQLTGLQDLYWGELFESTNKSKKANEKFQSAFLLSKNANDVNTQIESSFKLGKNYEISDKKDEAEFWYLTAINLIEKISLPLSQNQDIQIAHFSGLNKMFDVLTNFYLQQGKVEEAFSTIERSRSRNTRINLDKLKLLSELGNDNDFNKLTDIEWMISSGLYNKPVADSLQKIITDLTLNLIKKNPSLEKILERKSLFSLKEIQSKLNANDYLVTVYVAEKFITLFNLNSKNLSFETLHIDRDSLLTMINSISPIYKTGLESDEVYVNEDLFSFNAQASYRLYNSVFKNILSGIPKQSSLIVSLPSELVELPLELLVTNWTKGESPYYYSDKKFLLDDYRISYTPSASIYCIQMENNQQINQQNLLVGDPYIDNSELTLSVRGGLIETSPLQARNIRLFPLKYSEAEIKSINSTLTNNRVFLYQHATESNFKQYAPMSNVVHISSHSFLVKDQPLVLFSGQADEKDDGFLELGEIVQLKLNCDMVVLSSCRSGLGRLDEAEGIVGMQKAFFEAGSKSVLVSLWDVNDKYTSYFMKDFYKYLAQGKSKSEALQKTKSEFIRKYSANPYYWSAFVLSGNPSTINLQEASAFQISHVLIIALIIGIVFAIILGLRKFL